MIKTKNITSTPFLLTFKETELPRLKEIPGEQAKTKVFEYYKWPISCMICLKYWHTVKRCHESKATCASCIWQGDNKDKCTSRCPLHSRNCALKAGKLNFKVLQRITQRWTHELPNTWRSSNLHPHNYPLPKINT